MTITSLKVKFEAGKSLNNQDLMFNLEMLKQVNHQVAVMLFDTYDRQSNDGKERQDTVQSACCRI